LWPVHATSTGKAILAATPKEERDPLVGGPLESYTPATITDSRVLESELDRVAERGYAVAREELGTGAAAVAVVVLDPLGRALGAISLGGPVSRLSDHRLDELGAALRSCAARISRRLQFAA
jgi:DNA-binding IclR family transcriptional regulator